MDTGNKGIKLYSFSPWAVFSNIAELPMEIWLTLCVKQVEKCIIIIILFLLFFKWKTVASASKKF